MCSVRVIGAQIRYFQPSMRATVVIPCYKPDRNFEKVLDDLNAQTSQEFEVLFADDGNTSPLEPRIFDRLKRPFRVIRFETNRGIVAGLNACIAAASSPWVIRMDADDRMPPHRIQSQIEFMLAHPDVDVCGTSMAVFGSGLRVWSKPLSASEVRAALLWGPSLNHPTVIAKTSVMQNNPYPEGYPLAEDYALWLRLAQQDLVMVNVPEVLLHYRMEGQNTSQNGVDKRAHRYLSMFEFALSTLLPEADLPALNAGVALGCHHRLAGMPLPSDLAAPSDLQMNEHAARLIEALAQCEAPWSRVARRQVETRLNQALGRTRWHKLRSVWDLRKLGLQDWTRLRSPGR